MIRKTFDRDEEEAIGYLRRWWPILLLVVAGLGAVSFALSTCGEAATVAREELGAKALLAKYRYFKRVAATLDARAADIAVMEASAAEARQTYGADPERWPRDVRERVSMDRDSLVALKMSFNSLAAEYNAAMADAFKRFTNVGEMPAGWPEEDRQPLRREFATYKLH